MNALVINMCEPSIISSTEVSPWKTFQGQFVSLECGRESLRRSQTNSCVNHVKTRRHHLVQEGREGRRGVR